MTEALRHYCRNKDCRTKLEVPTDNHHRAFCSRDCYKRFYRLKCFVCEKDLPKPKALCSGRDCRIDYRKFRHTYDFGQSPAKRKTDARSAHFTGLKNPLARVVAGPSLSDFSLWAATLEDPKPSRSVVKPNWNMDRQPGDLAAEWEANEWKRREAEDAQYIAYDEEWMRKTPLDASGNYPLRTPENGWNPSG
jgi:hypothetical protein